LEKIALFMLFALFCRFLGAKWGERHFPFRLFFHLFKVKRTYCPKKKSDYQMYRLNIPLYAKSTENLYGGVIKSVF